MLKPDFTIDRLRELISYDPIIGDMFWKTQHTNRIVVGQKINGKMKLGHLRVGINRKRYLAHRIAWFHYYGKWPTKNLDHKDGNAGNNAIDNLRECTQAQNLWNRNVQCNNLVSLKGVSRDNRRGTWFSRICVKGKIHFLGKFNTPEEAHQAYIKAAKKLHGEFARY